MLRCVIFMLIGGLWPFAALAQDLESLRNRAEQDPTALARLQRAASARDAKAAFYLGTRLLSRATETLHLSARAYHRVLRVARSIADLEGSDPISSQHLAEAIQYRRLAQTLAR